MNDIVLDKNWLKKFTFGNFLTDEKNIKVLKKMKLIADDFIENESTLSNKILIKGENCTGKTHLVLAFYNYILTSKKKTSLKMLYTTADIFSDIMILNMKDGTWSDKKKEIMNQDIIIIDNFENLQGKEVSQKNIFDIIDSLNLLGEKKIFVILIQKVNKLKLQDKRFDSFLEKSVTLELSKISDKLLKKIIKSKFSILKSRIINVELDKYNITAKEFEKEIFAKIDLNSNHLNLNSIDSLLKNFVLDIFIN